VHGFRLSELQLKWLKAIQNTVLIAAPTSVTLVALRAGYLRGGGLHGEATPLSAITGNMNDILPLAADFMGRVMAAAAGSDLGSAVPRWRPVDGFPRRGEPEQVPILVRVRIVGQCPSEGDVQEAGGSPTPPALPVDALY
jgi:hypothetical protein